ncbi:MAG: hypothetical protein H7A35_11050 [Planctomycetales bacterium]|nr:hypothetical protein [bacterium]UNM07402.1 MAG: hypothetical protein H7A35_11050 [Planctomycetales bacterium]
MKSRLASLLFVLATGFALAGFIVSLYTHWYFANHYWLKTGLAMLLTVPGYALALSGGNAKLWRGFGWYWIGLYALSVFQHRSIDLRELSFVAGLDYEASMVWLPGIVLLAVAMLNIIRQKRAEAAARRETRRALAFRRRLREIHGQPVVATGEWIRERLRSGSIVLLLGFATMLALGGSVLADEADAEPDNGIDRHSEFKDEALRHWPSMPDISGVYPQAAHSQERTTYFIEIDNVVDGEIRIVSDGFNGVVGHVLAPVSNYNKEGFTASGWAENGTCTASAVNAIHLKVKHNYETGRATIFSLVPIEFTTFDPKSYKSYFNQSSTLFTDITAGSEIFGGQWAPLVNSPLTFQRGEADWQRVDESYVPAVGDQMRITVSRRKYNPEWIEFENGFGGLIWIKELGMDPYPIGQVLKPVAGVGRFLGTQYAERGRIRAAHPGVIDISTSPYDVIGGFQIIPRDHAMSSEMKFARLKTQWMVVGPLWALDPSWEGLPPLFTDYLYPAFTPAFNADGSVNEDVQGAAVFLDRFTVRARYRDSEDPTQYELLRESVYLDYDALETMTHVRIYFPRG